MAILYYGLVKGLVGGMLIASAVPVLYYGYQVELARIQMYIAMAYLPWSFKAAVGAMTDAIPIHGYHKRWYGVVFGGLLPLGLIGLVVSKSAESFLVSQIICSTSIMASDVLLEGETSTLASYGSGGRKLNHRFFDLEWRFVMIGNTIGMTLMGIAITYDIIVPMLATAIPIGIGYALWIHMYHKTVFALDAICTKHKEYLIDSNQVVLFPSSLDNSEKLLVGLITLSSAMVFATAAAPSIGLMSVTFLVIFASLVILVDTANNRPALVGAAMYGFLSEVLHVDISAVVLVFYTSKCVESGPHYTFLTYLTMTSIVSGIFGAGVLSTAMFRFDARTTVIFSTCIRIGAACIDLAISLRWTTSVAVFLVGDAIVGPTGSLLTTVAMANLSSRVVPKNLETTWFAIVASFQNLGMSVSRVIGFVLMRYVMGNITECGTFTGYPELLIVARIILPLYAIPAAFLLVSNKE